MGKNTHTRSARFEIRALNVGKSDVYAYLLSQYRSAAQQMVEYLWNNRVDWVSYVKDEFGNKTPIPKVLDISHGHYEVPAFISTVDLEIESNLSARLLKCVATQACGLVAAVVNKRVKQLSKARFFESHGKPIPPRLRASIEAVLPMPSALAINAEVNSICANLGGSDGHFDLWLELTSLFSTDFVKRGFGIALPFNEHRHSRKLIKDGFARLNSFLLGDDFINVRYRKEVPPRTEGITLGADQGKKTMVTLSDGQSTPKCIHGHDLDSIANKMARRIPGSKSFKKAEDHRTNYTGWAVKRLDLTGVMTMNIENVFDFGRGVNLPKQLKHWSAVSIVNALKSRCELIGVQTALVESRYNSQRCSKCGWTQKANRKGKVFECKHCKHFDDADHNAACNVSIRPDLPLLELEFCRSRPNLKGFFWNPIGNQERTVPDIQKILHVFHHVS